MKSVPPPPPPPDIKGRNKTDLQKRKQIIRSLAVGGLAVTVWNKPIVNSVLLPAHAQTSGNTSGQAGEAGQVGQTEQGQTNQEQTAVPQQNQQQQQRNPGEPYHDRLEPLPAGNTLRIRPDDYADNCGTIQIVSIGFADRYHGPGIPNDKNYWIKIEGIQTPVVGNPLFSSSTLNRRAPLALRLVITGDFTVLPLDLSIDSASGNKNAHPARNTGMFTAFFRNWINDLNRPVSQVDLGLLVSGGGVVLFCDGTR